MSTTHDQVRPPDAAGTHKEAPMNLLIRLAIAALSLFVAAWLIPDIYIEGSTPWMVYAGMAVVLGLVNLLVKPILNLLTCPIQLITLGLFSLIVNAVAFWLASYLAVNFKTSASTMFTSTCSAVNESAI